eukprot:5206582-Pleurochrysis_carterae.AAC.1
MELDELLLRYPEMNELHDLNKQWKIAVNAERSESVMRQREEILNQMTEINKKYRKIAYAYSEITTLACFLTQKQQREGSHAVPESVPEQAPRPITAMGRVDVCE